MGANEVNSCTRETAEHANKITQRQKVTRKSSSTEAEHAPKHTRIQMTQKH